MTLAEHPVFATAGTEYRWADVALAAIHWDEWAELDAKARLGLTCAARAHATGGRPQRESLTARANAYRYEHDLISASQTVAWLGRRGLTTAMWMEWVERCLLREQVGPAPEPRPSSRKRLWKLSPTPFCYGLPGSM